MGNMEHPPCVCTPTSPATMVLGALDSTAHRPSNPTHTEGAGDWTRPEGTDILIRQEGPTEEALNTFIATVLEHPQVAEALTGVRYRVLATYGLMNEDKAELPVPADRARYVVQMYDYTNNRSLEVTSRFPDASELELMVSNRQPLPSSEEFEEAAEIVTRVPLFERFILCLRLVVYRPMPPLLEFTNEAGIRQRIVTVGLLPAEGSELRHQIVGVNMATQEVVTFEGGAPDTALASLTHCGIAPAYCPSPRRGTPGQMWIQWPAAHPIWRMLAVRPAASSGVSGSGLEIRFADYRGKRVLYHGHVPILNVQYVNNACGPYRDWQYEEHCFQVDGNDVGPGFRWTTTAPRTACSGDDAGNFHGVAIQSTECELILTTEMEAGWYRYIQEWRFHRDGTIRPRFRFAAVTNSCVCRTHVHHVYWRLDIDLRSPGNHLIEEFNNPPLSSTYWHSKQFELKRPRDPGRQRKWRVTNTATQEQYEIIPGPADGLSDAYGRGDLWFVRYHGNEIDDSANAGGTEARIDPFVNGEQIQNQDVVVWYGAHFRHDPNLQGPAECHAVGPTLRPTRW